MKMKKKIFLVLLLLPFFVFMVSEDEHSSSNFQQFLGKAINFIILFGGLAYFLSKPLRSYLEKRSLGIKHTLEEAENSGKEAEEKLKKAKVQLEGLGEKIAKIKEEADIEGLREKERIISEAKKEAERIKRLTKEEIEMLVRKGIKELKEYTIKMATILAEERIKKRITPEDHLLLIDRSIEKVSKLDEKSSTDKEIHPRFS